jgi:hypothetical protein
VRRSLALSLLLVAALAGALVPAYGRGANAAGAAPQVVNLTDHDFSVAWQTDTQTDGSILFGTSCANAVNGGQAEEDSDGTVHLVDAGGNLQADTTYYYKVVSGGVTDDNGGQCYQVHTFHQLSSLGTPDAVWGNLFAADCTTPFSGALVTLTIQHNSTTSLPLAATSAASGEWVITVGNALDSSGNPLTPVSGDQVTIVAAGGPDSSVSKTVTYKPPENAPAQMPDLCLPAVAASTGTVAPTGTGQPTSTAQTTTTALLTATAGPSFTTTSVPLTATAVATDQPAIGTAVPTSTVPSPLPTAAPTAPAPVQPAPSTTASREGQARVKATMYLTSRTVRAGGVQTILLRTLPGVVIRLQVNYQHHVRAHVAHGRADSHGLWQTHWHVPRAAYGRADVILTLTSGTRTRTFKRHFAITRGR